MRKLLITLGIILLVEGLLWPSLSKLGLGRLPGDLHIEREGFSLYFPITTMIIVSIVLTLIFRFGGGSERC
ncbi:DUF2905 domain-containing protein [Hyphococcus sp.]|uniref:DUF2905 domain-containing protein n=1 Tax=Hyphococcus sp. TaxID=2038636 RepID=UPI00208BB860|nr:MAG: hypothetical protein DHS20C04_04590 [Marinicaulis sp.]